MTALISSLAGRRGSWLVPNDAAVPVSLALRRDNQIWYCTIALRSQQRGTDCNTVTLDQSSYQANTLTCNCVYIPFLTFQMAGPGIKTGVAKLMMKSRLEQNKAGNNATSPLSHLLRTRWSCSRHWAGLCYRTATARWGRLVSPGRGTIL